MRVAPFGLGEKGTSLFRGDSSSTNDLGDPQMFRVAALVALVATLAACNVADIRELFSNAKAVASDLEQSTGMKPQVGFNWQNGRLETVTVLFPQIYEARPLGAVAEMVRGSVSSHFKQTPEDIVLAFSLGKPTSDGRAAP